MVNEREHYIITFWLGAPPTFGNIVRAIVCQEFLMKRELHLLTKNLRLVIWLVDAC